MGRIILAGLLIPLFSFSCGLDTNNGTESCPEDYTECGSVCCAPGKICASPGNCEFPYQTARLWVYLCPSFNDGCDAQYFMLDDQCVQIGSFTRGACYDTGFEVNPGRTYGMAVCQGCPGDCSNPVGFTTPSGFVQPDFDSNTYWYCQTECEKTHACPQP
jgi:hypothetical protein